MAAPSRFQQLRGKDAHSARVQQNINATLQPIANAVNNTPLTGAPPPAWILASLLAADAVPLFWSNTGGALAKAAFHRDALGYVHSKGVITNNSAAPSVFPPFFFPPGYRVAETHRIPVAYSGGVMFITLTSDGAVTPQAVASGGFIGLDFTFLAEN